MVRSMDFGVMAEDMSWVDGEMEGDVCGSCRRPEERDRASMVKRQSKVNEIPDLRSSVGCNLSVSEGPNGASINDNRLTAGLWLLSLGCPRLSWASPSLLTGEPDFRTYGVEGIFAS